MVIDLLLPQVAIRGTAFAHWFHLLVLEFASWTILYCLFLLNYTEISLSADFFTRVACHKHCIGCLCNA